MARTSRRGQGGRKTIREGNVLDLADRLQKARATAGLSTRMVADELPQGLALSHATIANYERGRTIPSMAMVAALADVYRRPVDWFFQSAVPFTETAVRHPQRAVSPAKKDRFQSRAHQWLEAYLKLERRLGRPLAATRTSQTLCRKASDDLAPVDLAVLLREHLALDDSQSVVSVVELMETFGIRVIEVPAPAILESMAGCLGDKYAVVLNPATPNDRCRMLAAHELGHFLYGHHTAGRLESQNEENKAYTFASHLLLPAAALEQVFASRSILELVTCKQNFGIPLSAMMFRAERARLIDKKSARWLGAQFAKRGWKKREPGVVRPDRATRFERLLETAIFDGHLKWVEVESITGFSREELEARGEHTLSMVLGWNAASDNE